ncbi:hypothetical protein HGRIS_009326 [Hohenbuehelia grisea]|uniref:Zn-dependent exopeptidase n=1 Tax=Hohenbuehelia grisea TaxID=104357 RepID=A0ABR3J0W9_9AGAR
MIIMDPEKNPVELRHASPAPDGVDEPEWSAAQLKRFERKERRRRGRKRFVRLVITLAIVVGFAWYRSSSRASPYRYHSFDGPHHKKPLSNEESEKLFLSIPNPESALAASRDYATHPHLAGSTQDFSDAQVILQLFQDEFGITPPKKEPIYDAGSHASRFSTLGLTSSLRLKSPSAWIDVYYPVMNTPLDRQLSILGDDGKAVWEADLVEDGDPNDPEAHKYRDYVPAWHGLSKHGDAEGELVYANYGTQEDYAELVEAGANLTGKIVVTRYGGIFRGLKILGAQQLGAAGVLIYSDPRDDGYVTVENGYKPYPAGPARNPTSVQRGSVQFLSVYPGDPTTPGYPAYKEVNRTEGENIPKIPSLPISWQNAERLLEEIDEIYLDGGKLKEGKRRLSGKSSKAKVKLVNHVDNKVTPIWNTMAAIPGHIKDEVVIIGCHRDAWVMGAADPTSGTVSVHEVIKGFGALLKNGWKPLRTVVFASWDAEEYGLIGSTEYGEDFASWISDHVVAYLNLDVSVAGTQWTASASPSLAHLLKGAAEAVPHPTIRGRTVWDARHDEGPFEGLSQNGSVANVDAEFLQAYTAQKLAAPKTNIGPLGSGSDFTVFLQRLGVPSSDSGFKFTPTDAVYHYHSIYDSQHWQEVYADPGFVRHVAVAKQHGLTALRIVNSIILPFNTTQYALELDDYLDKVEALALTTDIDSPNFAGLRNAISAVQSASFKLDEEKVEAEKKFKEVLAQLPGRHTQCRRRNKFFDRMAQWVKFVFGVRSDLPPPMPDAGLAGHDHHGDMEIHMMSLDELEHWEAALESGFEIDQDEAHMHPRIPHGFPILKFIKAARRVGRANKKLRSFERGFIHEDGIKEREWYRHLGVAPGKWLGYGATTLPALTEAIALERNSTLVAYEASRLTNLLNKLAKEIHP